MVAPGRCSTSASGKTSSSVPAKKSFVAQPVRTSGWGPAGAARPSCRAVLSRATSAPQAVMADTGSSADMGLGAFAAWARQSGIQFEATQPANFDGLRGVAAKAPIKADELLMSVPRSAALTLGPKAKCPFQDFVTPTYWSSAPWFVKMGLKLLNERRRGSASPLAPYLASLPAAVDAPIFWTDGQLQMLQYPHLIQQVREIRAAIREYCIAACWEASIMWQHPRHTLFPRLVVTSAILFGLARTQRPQALYLHSFTYTLRSTAPSCRWHSSRSAGSRCRYAHGLHMQPPTHAAS